MLQNDIESTHSELPIAIRRECWFQQYGMLAHNLTQFRKYPNKNFGNPEI